MRHESIVVRNTCVNLAWSAERRVCGAVRAFAKGAFGACHICRPLPDRQIVQIGTMISTSRRTTDINIVDIKHMQVFEDAQHPLLFIPSFRPSFGMYANHEKATTKKNCNSRTHIYRNCQILRVFPRRRWRAGRGRGRTWSHGSFCLGGKNSTRDTPTIIRMNNERLAFIIRLSRTYTVCK